MRSATGLLPGFVKAPLKKALSHPSSPIQEAFVNLLVELYIWFHHVWGQRTLRSLRGRRDLKVNLGCGLDIRPGWVNLDLFLPSKTGGAITEPDSLLISHDLRRGLPLEPQSCSYIYSSHFFEHLDCPAGLALMQDCYKLLKPGGSFRIVLPDFRKVFAAYLGDDRDYFDLIDNPQLVLNQPFANPDSVVLMDLVNYAIYQHGEHKCAYDVEKLVQLLRSIGYSQVSESAFREDIDADDPLRTKYSFYVEAIK